MNAFKPRLPVLIAVVAVALAADEVKRPSPRVLRFLGDRAAEVLAHADRLEVFRIASERAKEGETAVGGYRVDAIGGDPGETAARESATRLLDEKTYRFETSKLGGFIPRVGLRWSDGQRRVEAVLSPTSGEIVVFSRNPEDDSVRSAQQVLSDDAAAALLALAAKALPADAGGNRSSASGKDRRRRAARPATRSPAGS